MASDRQNPRSNEANTNLVYRFIITNGFEIARLSPAAPACKCRGWTLSGKTDFCLLASGSLALVPHYSARKNSESPNAKSVYIKNFWPAATFHGVIRGSVLETHMKRLLFDFRLTSAVCALLFSCGAAPSIVISEELRLIPFPKEVTL